MLVWRICQRRWAGSAFSGLGAAENPGRWNSAGMKAVYCAESRSLAAWEILVNTPDRRTLARARFVVIPADVPDDLIVRPNRYPANWDAKPVPVSTREFGDRFLKLGRGPVLRVPSATVRGEFCYLLNPVHPRFSEISIGRAEAFVFDRRATADKPRP